MSHNYSPLRTGTYFRGEVPAFNVEEGTFAVGYEKLTHYYRVDQDRILHITEYDDGINYLINSLPRRDHMILEVPADSGEGVLVTPTRRHVPPCTKETFNAALERARNHLL